MGSLFRHIGILACCSVTVCFVAAQQIGSPAPALGGAGLAFPSPSSAPQNPAAFAFESRGPIPGPFIRYSASGLDIAQVSGFISGLRHGVGFAPSNFSNSPFDEWDDMGGSIGISFGNLNFSWFGRGVRESVGSNGLGSTNGLGFEGYSVSEGASTPIREGRLAYGVTGRWFDAFATHASGSVAHLNEGSGFSADLGLLYTPNERRDLHFGFVVDNFVPPQIPGSRFDSYDMRRAQAAIFGPCLNFGIAGAFGPRLEFAVDAIDLGNRTSQSQVAVGLERSLGGVTAVELGYNSRTSFTLGFSFFGIYARIAGRSPLTLGTSIRF